MIELCNVWHAYYFMTLAMQAVLLMRRWRKPHDDFEYLAPPADEWEVSKSRLTIKEEIGSGEYGLYCVD